MAKETARASEGHSTDSVETVNQSVRRGSLTAGIALLVMTPLAVFANFAVLESLVTPGNAAQTATEILDTEGTFRLATASLFVVAVLDLIVAWALYTVFRPVNSSIALLMAWSRVVFAGVFMVAISHLVGALSILNTADSAFSTDQHYAQALLEIDAFYDIWDAALILVGVHLVILGYLVYRSGAIPSYKSGYIPKVLGVLLAIAGAGYMIDSFGRVLVADYLFEVAVFTFLGEILLIFWLFIYGRRVNLDGERISAAD
ncbi:DUF4386 domain-containing protein [Halovenus marina]|uniref:DUF4386 domain-containing protein n=1 Tax=Halovenus marina TaxID=3396621 RepID=UPI003F5663A4